MNTSANVKSSAGSHWYFRNGDPCYQVPMKTKSGMKKTTLADARELDLLPSVTTILRVLDKPALNEWKTEQAVLAALTSPRLSGESVDDFIHRIFQVERVQEAEAAAAAAKGTGIHDAIADALQAKPFDPQYTPYVKAVFPMIEALGKVVWVERILIGDGYAGRSDLLVENDVNQVLLDFKSTKKIPKQSYDEHKIQTAFYAKTLPKPANKHLLTGNIYLSTANPGEISLSAQEDWEETYERAAKPLIQIWNFLNDYYPGGKI